MLLNIRERIRTQTEVIPFGNEVINQIDRNQHRGEDIYPLFAFTQSKQRGSRGGNHYKSEHIPLKDRHEADTRDVQRDRECVP